MSGGSFWAKQYLALDNLRKSYRQFTPWSIFQRVWQTAQDDNCQAEFVSYIESHVRGFTIVHFENPADTGEPFLYNFLLGRIIRYGAQFGMTNRCGIEPDEYLRLAVKTLRFYRDFIDPLSHDEEIKAAYQDSNPTYVISRFLYDQQKYGKGLCGVFPRLTYLWKEAVCLAEQDRESEREFDFEGSFRAIFGVPLDEFANASVALWVASTQRPEFSRKLEPFKGDNSLISPADGALLSVLGALSITLADFRNTLKHPPSADDRFKRPEGSRFEQYMANPAYFRPIFVRSSERPEKPEHDDLCVPFPRLLQQQSSGAIYWELRAQHGKRFTSWFGKVFEQAVGLILKNSVSAPGFELVSENDIWEAEFSRKEKIPDWVIVEPDGTLILIECKAGVYADRMALAVSDRPFELHALKDVRDASEQLEAFQASIRNREPGLEQFDANADIHCVVLTYEDYPVTSSATARQSLTDYSIRLEDGLLMSLDELEAIQRFVEWGENPSEVFMMLQEKPASGILKHYESKYGCIEFWLGKVQDEVIERVFPGHRNYRE